MASALCAVDIRPSFYFDHLPNVFHKSVKSSCIILLAEGLFMAEIIKRILYTVVHIYLRI